MVKQRDAVELDPKPDDILSVWGLEVTDQNIERYIRPAALPGGKKCAFGAGRKHGKYLGLLEESLGLSYLENSEGQELEGRQTSLLLGNYAVGNAVFQVSSNVPSLPKEFLFWGLRRDCY